MCRTLLASFCHILINFTLLGITYCRFACGEEVWRIYIQELDAKVETGALKLSAKGVDSNWWTIFDKKTCEYGKL